MIETVPATSELVADLWPRLRTDDLLELMALCPEDPRSLIDKSLDMSAASWVLMVDGLPGAIWGVQVLEDKACAVWMLSTPDVPRHSRFIAKYSKSIIAGLLRVYSRIEILVDGRYEVSKRWLEWLGFDLGPAIPAGPLGILFHKAVRRA